MGNCNPGDKEGEQEALLSEHRVPDFLEGVPIQIIPKEIANMADDFQGGGIDERDPHVNLVFEVTNKNRTYFTGIHPSKVLDCHTSTLGTIQAIEFGAFDFMLLRTCNNLACPRRSAYRTAWRMYPSNL